MPVSLRRFGLELNREFLEREKLLVGSKGVVGGEFGDALQQLDDQLVVFIVRLARRIYKNNRISRDEWNRIKRRVMNVELMTPFFDFRDRTAKITEKFQRDAFLQTMDDMKSAFSKLYPVRFRTVSKKVWMRGINDLEFMDSKLELKFLRTGREVSENVFEEMFRIRDVLREGNEIYGVDDYFEQKGKRKSIDLFIGTGKPNKDFLMFLERQLQVGLAPADLITTVSTQHVADMQRILLRNINKGLDVSMARREFMRRLSKDMLTGAERSKLAFNTMRIMRTAHQRAATSATSLFGLRNRDIVRELERVADGRPCLACAYLDGTRWPLGSTISDHQMGMCVFVPVVRTLGELGFDEDEIPSDFGLAFEIQGRSFPTMFSRFMAMSEKDQRLVFGNNRLYNFWKAEKFPLREVVVKKNGMFVSTSFREISARVDKLGGVSFPKAEIGFDFTKIKGKPDVIKDFMANIDPVDRANKNLILIRGEDLPKELQFLRSEFVKEGDGFGLGMVERFKLDPRMVAKADDFVKFYADGAVPGWWDINEQYRTLGLYLRKGADGRSYFAISRRRYAELLKKKGELPKKPKKIGKPKIDVREQNKRFFEKHGSAFDEDELDDFATVFGKDTLAEDVVNVFKITPEDKLDILIMDTSTDFKIRIVGEWGELERTVQLTSDGLRVFHNAFKLEPSIQQFGLGKSYLKKVVEQYRKLGIKRIELDANIDVGGYAWARMGFEITTSRGMENLSYRVLKEFQVRFGESELNKLLRGTKPQDFFKSVNEIANFTFRGKRFGKEALLGEGWPGFLDLTNKTQMSIFNAYVKDARPLDGIIRELFGGIKKSKSMILREKAVALRNKLLDDLQDFERKKKSIMDEIGRIREERYSIYEKGSFNEFDEALRNRIAKINERATELGNERTRLIRLYNEKVQKSLRVHDDAFEYGRVAIDEVFSTRQRNRVVKALEDFTKYLDESVFPSDRSVYVFRARTLRSYHSAGRLYLDDVSVNSETIFHEMGHWIEYNNSEVRSQLIKFYRKRTAGEKPKWLGDSYDKSELTRKDKFVHPYMGKSYGNAGTELLSMGMELLLKNPSKLIKQDPEMFDFLYVLLRGGNFFE